MSDIANLVKNLERPKISIIMQSYLEDYPGSRTNSVKKFKRAVKSFQNQLYKNCELIIVSDSCIKTQKTYFTEFKNDPSIKFIFIDKDTPNMYDLDVNGNKYYRGFPRRVGVAAATGSLITYMDSDDFLLPEFTLTLLLAYNSNTNLSWWINTNWYDNENANWEDSNELCATNHEDDIAIEGLKGKWTKTKVKPGMGVLSPWLLMHKAECITKWRDIMGNISEDVDFNRRLRSEYPNGTTLDKAIYVRCHYTNAWDI